MLFDDFRATTAACGYGRRRKAVPLPTSLPAGLASGPAPVSSERNVYVNRLPATALCLCAFVFLKSAVDQERFFGSRRNRNRGYASLPVQSMEHTDVAISQTKSRQGRLRGTHPVRFRPSPAGVRARGSPLDPSGGGDIRRKLVPQGERGRDD